jgi:hypothetical protein
MAAMPTTAPFAFSRRALLAASAAGLGALLVGCTSDQKPPVTAQQADELAGQVAAQDALVAAFAAAAAADPAVGTDLADLAGQVQQQLDRLRAAAPGPSASASSSAPAPPAGQDVRGWLRGRVTAAADSHAKACLDQTGARAALLGSIAAGLRGMDARFA